MEITLHISIRKVPNEYLQDAEYEDTFYFIEKKVKELVEGLEGELYDLEIK